MMSDAPSNLTVASCVQKSKDAKVTDVMDAHLLEWLAEHGPKSSSDALQITEVLTSCWEKYGGLEKFSADAVMSMLRAAQRLLLLSQDSSQVLSSLLVLASKIQSWCERSLSSSTKQLLDLQSCQASSKTQTVLLEALKLANALFTNLDNCSFFEEKEFRNGTEIFICQFLDALKNFCIICQRTQSYDEFQKIAQEVLSEVLKVLVKLRAKFIAACGERSFESLDRATLERAHIIWYGVSAFMDIGKFAAVSGRDWVGMLNVAWKGVTALLQTMARKDAMSRLLDIHLIIRTLIGCTTESLKNAAESWNTVLQEKNNNINVAELKRFCIPVKFFLINVIRVVTHYPCQAVDAFSDIVKCALEIISLRLELSECPRLKFAAETIVETLEPSLFILLCTLLNSSEIEFQVKLHFLNNLFGTENEDGSFIPDYVDTGELDKVNEGDASQDANLQLGRLMLFLGLLQSCQNSGDKMFLELAKRLDFSLRMICDPKIYAKMFKSQVSTTRLTAKAIWQTLYITLLKTLQMFFVALAGTEGWAEAEEFLYQNVLHPHTLCRELILELWCFVSRHSERNMVKDHIQDLLHVLSDLLKSSIATCSDWPVRTITRLICLLIKADPHYLATELYEVAFERDPFAAPSTVEVASALLKEHFPISILPEELKSLFIASAKRALSEFSNQGTKNFREDCEKLQLVDKTLCCLMECLYQENFEPCSDPEKLHELAKMSIDLLQVCHRKFDRGIGSQSLKCLSGVWQKMHPDKIRSIVVPLHHLMVKNKLPEIEQRRLKLSLAEALAGLGEVSMPEDDTDPTNCALWELYHVILQERHWAFAHLALASFGYFVAHTSWNELWRFVPSDAALAHDGITGNSAKEKTFMTSLRCFLEKEVVSTSLIENDVKALQQEGELLQRALLEFKLVTDRARNLEAQEIVDCDHMDVDSGVHMDTIESSLPPGINDALSMLQKGMLLLKENLPTWFKESGQSLEQQHRMHDQLCLLADVIGQLNVLQPIE